MKKTIFSALILTLLVLIPTPVSAKTLKGTLTELMLKGKSLKCTYAVKIDKKTIKGTIYTANKKFRSEFKLPYLNEKNSTAYTLSDGKNIYMWSSAEKIGTKMNLKKMEALGKNQSGDQQAQQTAAEMQKKYQYNCTSWSAKKNFFQVPKNVTFTDLSAMMEGLKGMGEQIKKGAAKMQTEGCKICESLPEAVRQQCLENCN